jgi:hypothetical protein
MKQLVPKFMPVSVSFVPPLVGAFGGATLVTFGASYEKYFVLLCCSPTVTVTTRSAPCPTGSVHVI